MTAAADLANESLRRRNHTRSPRMEAAEHNERSKDDK
jgi:hypothetical protein